MNCANAKEAMADAWAGQIDERARARLDAHLANCAECAADMEELGALWSRLGDLPAPEPSTLQHVRWEAALSQIERSSRERRVISIGSAWSARSFWPALAAACLVIGFFAGANSHKRSGEAAEISVLRKEVEATREMAALSLLGQQSATERLRGVDYSQRMTALEPRVVSALIQAVNSDPNVNVRLAAIDALARAADDAQVRQSLAASLERQESPMVQTALIDYLVDARDQGAVPILREIRERPDVDMAVKQHALVAVRTLGESR